MRYLLDTHALIWYFEDSSNLPPQIKKMIDKPENDICICSVSLWEIVIKISLNKLKINLTMGELFRDIKNSDFSILQIESLHLKALAELPFIHKDPFDRLLVSTAIAENLTIISADEYIHRYDIPFAWNTISYTANK